MIKLYSFVTEEGKMLHTTEGLIAERLQKKGTDINIVKRSAIAVKTFYEDLGDLLYRLKDYNERSYKF